MNRCVDERRYNGEEGSTNTQINKRREVQDAKSNVYRQQPNIPIVNLTPYTLEFPL
jgi:hypothetical protein